MYERRLSKDKVTVAEIVWCTITWGMRVGPWGGVHSMVTVLQNTELHQFSSLKQDWWHIKKARNKLFECQKSISHPSHSKAPFCIQSLHTRWCQRLPPEVRPRAIEARTGLVPAQGITALARLTFDPFGADGWNVSVRALGGLTADHGLFSTWSSLFATREGVLGPLLSNNFHPIFFLFFHRERQEKHEIFLKFENLTEGKTFWRTSHSNISKAFGNQFWDIWK